MTARRRTSALAGRKAEVIGECNGFAIKVSDVDATHAGLVLADLVETFRVLKRKYPELLPDLSPVMGGTPIDVVDDDWADESHQRRSKRIGFAK